MSIKRNFIKNAVTNLLEADGFDGDLNVDSPEYFVRAVRIDAENLKIYLDIIFTVMQGSLEQKHQRTFVIDYTTLPQGAKDQFKGLYDFVVNNLPSYITKLAGSIEQ